jgi:hypothetical protein
MGRQALNDQYAGNENAARSTGINRSDMTTQSLRMVAFANDMFHQHSDVITRSVSSHDKTAEILVQSGVGLVTDMLCNAYRDSLSLRHIPFL